MSRPRAEGEKGTREDTWLRPAMRRTLPAINADVWLLTTGRGELAFSQRSRSNSSCDTSSCRRIVKNSGGPISRPPCRGMVTDRPSPCVQRSWLPSGAASRNRAFSRRPLKLARCRARHARFQSCPSEGRARGPDAPWRSMRIPARARPRPPRACPSTRSSLRWPGSRPPRIHRPAGRVRPCPPGGVTRIDSVHPRAGV